MRRIVYRAMMPTPSFFRRIIKLAIVLLAIAVSIITAPVDLHPTVAAILDYVVVGSVVAIIISQLTVDTDKAFLSWINGEADTYMPGNFNKDLLK